MFNKLELAKGLISQLKFYINPEIYKMEKDSEKEEQAKIEQEKEMPNKARNLFEDISIQSKQDGVFRLPKELRDIMNRVEKNKQEQPLEDEEDVLG